MMFTFAEWRLTDWEWTKVEQSDPFEASSELEARETVRVEAQSRGGDDQSRLWALIGPPLGDEPGWGVLGNGTEALVTYLVSSRKQGQPVVFGVADVSPIQAQ